MQGLRNGPAAGVAGGYVEERSASVTQQMPPYGPSLEIKKVVEDFRKPGSVPRSGCPRRGGDHSSGTAVADGLKQPTREPRTGRPQTLPYSALLRMGFTEHPTSPPDLVSSYLTLSPSPRQRHRKAATTPGGLLSVALSLGSPPVPVRNHPALRSPDFPPPAVHDCGQRSPGSLRPPSACVSPAPRYRATGCNGGSRADDRP